MKLSLFHYLMVVLLLLLSENAYSSNLPTDVNSCLLGHARGGCLRGPAAFRYSPVFISDRYKDNSLQECPYNIPTQVSFDGDWNPLNNEENYESILSSSSSASAPLKIASIYYEEISSSTHIFLTYYLFYPHDAGDGCAYSEPTDAGGHQNDASSLMLILRHDKDGTFIDRIMTMDNGLVTVKTPDEVKMIRGRPVIVIKNGTHQMTALDNSAGLPDADSYYRFGMETPYSLEPIFTSIWLQKENEELFCLFSGNVGIRYCEEENKTKGRGTPPWAPWAREFKPTVTAQEELLKTLGLAQSFFDPIKAFGSLYANDRYYSSQYIYNPYLNGR